MTARSRSNAGGAAASSGVAAAPGAGEATGAGENPFRLFTVSLYAHDLEGDPVPGARIYAFNTARTMFGCEVRDHSQPAGEARDDGHVDLRVPAGEWRVLGVGQTGAGRAWLVSRTVEIGPDGEFEVVLEPRRALKVEGRGFNKTEVQELDLAVRPAGWPRWWKPAWMHNPTGAQRRADRSIEAAVDGKVEVWLRSRVEIDRKFQFGRVSFAGNDKVVSLAPPGRDSGTIRVAPPKRRKGDDTHVFFVLESLDFKGRHPFLYPMHDDEIALAVRPGDYVLRHYVEWITERGKYHGEFANVHVRFDARNRVHEYATTDRFDVRPVLQVFGPGHAQLWLDALDDEGNRLDWFVAPRDEPFGELRVYDTDGELASTLEVSKAKHFWSPRGALPRFPTAGSYELEADFELWRLPEVGGEFTGRRRDELPRVDLPHLSIVYPRGATDDSTEWLERRALELAPALERMLIGAYEWYGLEPATGIVVDFQLCSPTAGASSGRSIALSLDYLLRGGPYSAHGWGTYAHELGHSLHVIDPLDAFLQRTDNDHIGLYNESQASFMGSKGAAFAFQSDDLLDGVAFAAQGFLRKLRGEKEGIGDEKQRLAYLCHHLERQLGEEFSRRYLRLAHLEPRELRDRIRDRGWSPVEKIAALFSIAAEQDLTTAFRSAGFEVGLSVCAEALKL